MKKTLKARRYKFPLTLAGQRAEGTVTVPPTLRVPVEMQRIYDQALHHARMYCEIAADQTDDRQYVLYVLATAAGIVSCGFFEPTESPEEIARFIYVLFKQGVRLGFLSPNLVEDIMGRADKTPVFARETHWATEQPENLAA
jgi:hypothetical protein